VKPTNRPVTSREYKLVLNTERFRDRVQGARTFWNLLAFLVSSQGNEVIPDDQDPEKDDEFRRTTRYLDTPGDDLQRVGAILRVRQEISPKKGFKVTLKYRAPDRYIAAGCDLSCTQDFKEDDYKFEEDILPPFASKFSHSVSFKADDLPPLATIADLVALFPGVESHGIPASTPIVTANGFTAHEVMHLIGKFKLAKMPTPRGKKLPDFVVKAALTHWYLRDDEDDYPLVTEFSFDYDVASKPDGDMLEVFPPTLVAGANRLFRDIQGQGAWLAPQGTTKSAFAYETS
jgi:hypothetical protein